MVWSHTSCCCCLLQRVSNVHASVEMHLDPQNWPKNWGLSWWIGRVLLLCSACPLGYCFWGRPIMKLWQTAPQQPNWLPLSKFDYKIRQSSSEEVRLRSSAKTKCKARPRLSVCPLVFANNCEMSPPLSTPLWWWRIAFRKSPFCPPLPT